MYNAVVFGQIMYNAPSSIAVAVEHELLLAGTHAENIDRNIAASGPTELAEDRSVVTTAYGDAVAEREIGIKGHLEAPPLDQDIETVGHIESAADRGVNTVAYDDGSTERTAHAVGHEIAEADRNVQVSVAPPADRRASRPRKAVGYYVALYNDNNQLVARLENASDISLDKELNSAGSFTFKIPRLDPKAEELGGGRIVKFFKKGHDTPMFVGVVGGIQRKVDWWHVAGKGAAWLLSYMRAGRNQYWEEVDYPHHSDVFTDLLADTPISVGSLATGSNPGFRANGESRLWCVMTYAAQVGLDWWIDEDLRLNTAVDKGSNQQLEFRHGVNCSLLEVDVDYDTIVNDLMLLGVGEGYWQLNHHGSNAESISAYGRRQGTITEREILHDAVLERRHAELLSTYKDPAVTYRIGVVDWQDLEFNVGDLVYVTSPKLGVVREQKRIVGYKLSADKNAYTMDVGEARRDIVDRINGIDKRVNVEAAHQQGSTIYLPYTSGGDNFSSSVPYVLRVFIPADVVGIGSARLNFWLSRHRAYATTTRSGGDDATTSSELSVVLGTWPLDTYTAEPRDEHFHVVRTWTLPADGPGEDHRHEVIDTTIGEIGHTHSVRIPGHTHAVQPHAHEVSWGSHSHGIDPAIHQTSWPSNVTVRVNGVDRTTEFGGPLSTDQAGISVKDYLMVGTTNTIEFYTSGLGRMEATVNIKAYTYAEVEQGD